MTENEKFDLILSKLDLLENEMQDMKSGMQNMKVEMQDMKVEMQDMKKDISAVKRQVLKSTAELKAMDEMVLDEVERVHGILEKHKEDKSAHSA